MPRSQSAVSKIKKSDYEIVKRPARKKGKVTSIKGYARLFESGELKPWPPIDGDPFSNKDICRRAVGARIAYQLMLKSKDELLAMHSEAEHKVIDAMMGELAEAEEAFKQIAVMCSAAYIRLLAAAAAHAERGGTFKVDGRAVRA